VNELSNDLYIESLEDKFKNACAFKFSRISYNILGAFSAKIFSKKTFKKVKKRETIIKRKNFRAYGRSGTKNANALLFAMFFL
jgi:hypothetical protein